MEFCEICGNEIAVLKKRCPFCGSEQELGKDRKLVVVGRLHKTVNLELGKPFVEAAINRLLNEIEQAKQESVSILTIIHGYGSTGKGGAIRVECRKNLDYLRTSCKIQDYVPGEDFNKKSGAIKLLLRRFPGLQQNKNLNRRNQGITIVVL